MKLGIDASNIRAGGGLTHIVELLGRVDPSKYGFEKVIVWGSALTLSLIDDRPWLLKRNELVLEKNFIFRAFWQWQCLGELAEKEGCDLLFVPGGSFLTTFRPIVVMSQNLLPFEWKEIKRYGLSLLTIKWLFLRISQTASFKKAGGIIFLTEYARDVVLGVTGALPNNDVVIPHGLNARFFKSPRKQKTRAHDDSSSLLKIVYVSTIEPYKHQCNVVKAVSKLNKNGFPVTLDLYGSSNPSNKVKLNKVIKACDDSGSFIKYHGLADHTYIHQQYIESDIAVFASSCETFGQILIEAMAAGLPVACSNLSAMPEILKDGGVYFNPLDPDSISIALESLIESPELRFSYAQKAYELASKYSWERCVDETFSFLKLHSTKQA